jgi:hypothetical protein
VGNHVVLMAICGVFSKLKKERIEGQVRSTHTQKPISTLILTLVKVTLPLSRENGRDPWYSTLTTNLTPILALTINLALDTSPGPTTLILTQTVPCSALSGACQVRSTSGAQYDTTVKLPLDYYRLIGVAAMSPKVLELGHYPEQHWKSCRRRKEVEAWRLTQTRNLTLCIVTLSHLP